MYYSIPDHDAQFADFCAGLASRPKWTFAPAPMTAADRARFIAGQWQADWVTPDPKNRRRGDEPLILSEFGNWGLPDLDKLRAHYKGDPWWFKTGMQHGSGEVYPDGVDARYRLYHLDRAFPTLKALTDASQRMQQIALKYELEAMRRHAPIQGDVITEFTDLHWECNGLLDMARNPKRVAANFADVNADDVITPSAARTAYWEGETVEIGVDVSHYSARDLSKSEIVWSVKGAALSGALPAISPRRFDVTAAGRITFRMPAVKQNMRLRLDLKLVSGGRTLARNTLDLYAFTRASARPARHVALYAPEHAAGLRALGYRVVDALADADMAVCGRFTDALRDYALGGGAVLWLAETDDAQQSSLHGLCGASVGKRAGTPWSGDWASNFNWLNRDVLFKDIPTDGLLDFAFADLIPEHVIHGVHPAFYARDVHAGLFLGWIQKTVALIADRTVGRGRLRISTFRLREHMATHPVAAVLVRDLLRM